MDFDAVARELYGLPPGEFIAARNARTKQARTDGEVDLARQVQALRKPTVAAWLVNQLARERRDEVTLLLDLGGELRRGLTDLTGEELRELTRRRYELVSSLVDQAREVGHSRGSRVSDDVAFAVRTTLEATLSDPASAAAVAAGCLSDTLDVTGFGLGDPDVGDVVTLAPLPAIEHRASVTDLGAHRQRRVEAIAAAQAEVDAAERRAEHAHERSDMATDRLADAERQEADEAARVAGLAEQLHEAEAALELRSGEARQTRGAAQDAERAARRADRELREARERLGRLTR